MLSVKRYECACAQPNLEAAVGFVTLALGLAGGVCGLVELCAQVLHLVLQRGNLSQASKAREEGDGATAGTVLSQQIEGGGEKQTPAKTNQGEHTHTHANTHEHTHDHTTAKRNVAPRWTCCGFPQGARSLATRALWWQQTQSVCGKTE